MRSTSHRCVAPSPPAAVIIIITIIITIVDIVVAQTVAKECVAI